MRPRIITLASIKGGVGKTTIAVNVACGLARYLGPNKVLLIDIDPQANATAVLLGMQAAAGPRREDAPVIEELLMEQADFTEVAQAVTLQSSESRGKVHYPESILHILPSHLSLAAVEPILATTIQGEYRLLDAIEAYIPHYEAIIIDCPPSLGALTFNALVVSDEVIIPVTPGIFPLVGLSYLQQTIQKAQRVNKKLKIAGVLPNLVERTLSSQDTMESLEKEFPGRILPSIPKRTVINDAHGAGLDVFAYDPAGDGSQAFDTLIRHLMEN